MDDSYLVIQAGPESISTQKQENSISEFFLNSRFVLIHAGSPSQL